MLTKEEVFHIAELARITLTEAETEKYQKDLSAILAYFDQLQEVNTEGVEPIGHSTGVVNVYRADKAEEFDKRGKSLICKNFPKQKDGCIRVQSVLS